METVAFHLGQAASQQENEAPLSRGPPTELRTTRKNIGRLITAALPLKYS
jgi:hypothetical protein